MACRSEPPPARATTFSCGTATLDQRLESHLPCAVRGTSPPTPTRVQEHQPAHQAAARSITSPDSISAARALQPVFTTSLLTPGLHGAPRYPRPPGYPIMPLGIGMVRFTLQAGSMGRERPTRPVPMTLPAIPGSSIAPLPAALYLPGFGKSSTARFTLPAVTMARPK